MLPKRNPPQNKRPTQTESEGLGKNIPSKWTGKKSWGSNTMSDKIDCKTKVIKRDTEGHSMTLKGRSHQEDINIAIIYASNIGASKYKRKILEDFKKDIGSNTLILGAQTPLCLKCIDLPNKISTRTLQH